MEKHPACAEVCQYASDADVWPSHWCSPVCMYLRHPEYFGEESETPATGRESGQGHAGESERDALQPGD